MLIKEACEVVTAQLGQSNVFTFGIGSSVNRHLVESLVVILISSVTISLLRNFFPSMQYSWGLYSPCSSIREALLPARSCLPRRHPASRCLPGAGQLSVLSFHPCVLRVKLHLEYLSVRIRFTNLVKSVVLSYSEVFLIFNVHALNHTGSSLLYIRIYFTTKSIFAPQLLYKNICILSW